MLCTDVHSLYTQGEQYCVQMYIDIVYSRRTVLCTDVHTVASILNMIPNQQWWALQ